MNMHIATSLTKINARKSLFTATVERPGHQETTYCYHISEVLPGLWEIHPGAHTNAVARPGHKSLSEAVEHCFGTVLTSYVD